MNLARRTMNHPAFALAYERIWRPTSFLAATGRTMLWKISPHAARTPTDWKSCV